MKSVYERTNMIITEFDTEDVITTSGAEEDPTSAALNEKENYYSAYNNFRRSPGAWF